MFNLEALIYYSVFLQIYSLKDDNEFVNMICVERRMNDIYLLWITNMRWNKKYIFGFPYNSTVCVCVCVCEREREKEMGKGGGGGRRRKELYKTGFLLKKKLCLDMEKFESTEVNQ